MRAYLAVRFGGDRDLIDRRERADDVDGSPDRLLVNGGNLDRFRCGLGAAGLCGLRFRTARDRQGQGRNDCQRSRQGCGFRSHRIRGKYNYRGSDLVSCKLSSFGDSPKEDKLARTRSDPLPEVWLRGPVAGIPALLQPVAHSLLQCREEVAATLENLTTDQIWNAPAGARVDRIPRPARGRKPRPSVHVRPRRTALRCAKGGVCRGGSAGSRGRCGREAARRVQRSGRARARTASTDR